MVRDANVPVPDASMPDVETEVRCLLLESEVDLEALRRMSRTPGGYQTHDLRKLVWPKLLGVNKFDVDDYKAFLLKHRDDYQVWCDITRLWGYLHPIAHTSDHYQGQRRKQVGEIIAAILCRDEHLYYYQGFHDVSSSFLLILQDNALTFAVLEAATSVFFKDFMKEDFHVFGQSMALVMTMISLHDEKLFIHLTKIPHFQPFFATSWIITWFSHEMDNVADIARIFDVMLASHPLFVYYLCAVLLMDQRDAVLEQEPDMANVHSVLMQAPSQLIARFDSLVARADKLMDALSPDTLLNSCDPALSVMLRQRRFALLEQPAELRERLVSADWVLLRSQQLGLHQRRVEELRRCVPSRGLDEELRTVAFEQSISGSALRQRLVARGSRWVGLGVALLVAASAIWVNRCQL